MDRIIFFPLIRQKGFLYKKKKKKKNNKNKTKSTVIKFRKLTKSFVALWFPTTDYCERIRKETI